MPLYVGLRLRRKHSTELRLFNFKYLLSCATAVRAVPFQVWLLPNLITIYKKAMTFGPWLYERGTGLEPATLSLEG